MTIKHPAVTPLIVLLPGAYTTPEDFAREGFHAALAAHHGNWELQIPPLELDEISNGTALPRLRREWLLPAREAGRQVWLGGISLGGFLAMAYARNWPGEVAGLCLLAPYPGSRITTGAIRVAGSLANWMPSEPDDPEAQVWTWLREGAEQLPCYLGYGREDRFADGMALLAAHWPTAQCQILPGGHEWPVWRDLWKAFLATPMLSDHG